MAGKSQLERPDKTLDELASEVNSYNRKPDNSISSTELSKLEGMSRDELIGLCGRFARQCGMVAAMTKEETAQAMRDVLAETALKPLVIGANVKADIQARMIAIDKWLDRTEGKASQSVTVNTTASVIHYNVEAAAPLLYEAINEKLERMRRKKQDVVIDNGKV